MQTIRTHHTYTHMTTRYDCRVDLLNKAHFALVTLVKFHIVPNILSFCFEDVSFSASSSLHSRGILIDKFFSFKTTKEKNGAFFYLRYFLRGSEYSWRSCFQYFVTTFWSLICCSDFFSLTYVLIASLSVESSIKLTSAPFHSN